VKSVWEHASIGIDDSAIIDSEDRETIAAAVAERAPRLGGSAFAERYVEGRELNLALIASRSGGDADPEVLPPAEIVFVDYPEGKPKIVGYSAKWEEGSFEYGHTARRYEFPREDQALIRELERQARAAWSAFGLGGYARVDFRVDAAGKPWILEVNANPCIAPDSGFVAALDHARISYDEAIERIVRAVPMQATRASRSQPRLRSQVRPQDARAVAEICASTGFFSEAEIAIAVELVEDRIARGDASSYQFLFYEDPAGGTAPVGYTCFGATPGTKSSYDLYWIVVHQKERGRGVGRILLEASEREIAIRGGGRVYVETSGRAQYEPTRAFYERGGYTRAAFLEEFYGPGDGKLIYVKTVSIAG
jgi:ribosomal protein S18 acetylase RimI-like enzyme